MVKSVCASRLIVPPAIAIGIYPLTVLGWESVLNICPAIPIAIWTALFRSLAWMCLIG